MERREEETEGASEQGSKRREVLGRIPNRLKILFPLPTLKWAQRADYKLVLMVVIPGEITEKLIMKYINKGH